MSKVLAEDLIKSPEGDAIKINMIAEELYTTGKIEKIDQVDLSILQNHLKNTKTLIVRAKAVISQEIEQQVQEQNIPKVVS